MNDRHPEEPTRDVEGDDVPDELLDAARDELESPPDETDEG